MRNIDIVTLRSLSAIMEYGGVTKAAEALHLTQSAISQHIKRLEGVLDIKIFIREGRALSITSQGYELLEYAKRMLRINDEILQHFNDTVTERVITIGISEHISHAYLPKILKACNKTSGIRPDIKVGLNSQLYTELAEGYIDIAFLINEHSTNKENVIGCQSVVWVSSPEYEVGSASKLPVVLYGGPCIFRTMILSTLDAHGIPWEVSYRASSIADLKAALHAGMGYSALLSCEVENSLTMKQGGEGCLPMLPDVELTMLSRDEHDETVNQILRVIKEKVFAVQ